MIKSEKLKFKNAVHAVLVKAAGDARFRQRCKKDGRKAIAKFAPSLTLPANLVVVFVERQEDAITQVLPKSLRNVPPIPRSGDDGSCTIAIK